MSLGALLLAWWDGVTHSSILVYALNLLPLPEERSAPPTSVLGVCVALQSRKAVRQGQGEVVEKHVRGEMPGPGAGEASG